MKRLFRGGTVVSGDGLKKMDVLVKGEKILAMGEDLKFKYADSRRDGETTVSRVH